MKYLRDLRKRFGSEPLALFMDGMGAHRDKDVKLLYPKLDMKPIMNVPYSPQFNPIESVFSQIKVTFCRARLNALVNKIPWDADK